VGQLEAVNVTGIVNVAPWQPLSDVFVIDTPGTVNDAVLFAAIVCEAAVVAKVTPVVTHPAAWPASGTAAPFALTDVIVTANGFGLFTVRYKFAPVMPGYNSAVVVATLVVKFCADVAVAVPVPPPPTVHAANATPMPSAPMATSTKATIRFDHRRCFSFVVFMYVLRREQHCEARRCVVM
jgi:hypothetical protein